MRKIWEVLYYSAVVLTLVSGNLFGAGEPPPLTPTQRAWNMLEEGAQAKGGPDRRHAMHTLRLLADNKRAIALAKAGLADRDENVRAEAAMTLGRMNGQIARPKLRGFGHVEIKVVVAAANALYHLKDPAAYQAYYALLTGEQKSKSGFIQKKWHRRPAWASSHTLGWDWKPFER